MSGSMEPTIPTGSLIISKPVAQYQVGDIVTFKSPNAKNSLDRTTHRIYDIYSDNNTKHILKHLLGLMAKMPTWSYLLLTARNFFPE